MSLIALVQWISLLPLDTLPLSKIKTEKERKPISACMHNRYGIPAYDTHLIGASPRTFCAGMLFTNRAGITDLSYKLGRDPRDLVCFRRHTCLKNQGFSTHNRMDFLYCFYILITCRWPPAAKQEWPKKVSKKLIYFQFSYLDAL